MKSKKKITPNSKAMELNAVLPEVKLGGLLKWIRENFNMKYNGWTPQVGEVGEINPFYTDKQLINKYHEKSRNRRKK